ncbi:MAG: hypothetical protein WCI46_04900 [Verrucomicrobiota bacterium]
MSTRESLKSPVPEGVMGPLVEENGQGQKKASGELLLRGEGELGGMPLGSKGKMEEERDRLLRELEELGEKLAKSEAINQRVAGLTEERDALAEQQAALSRQVAEFQKRGKLGSMIGGGERPTKAQQRQVDEWQRRIAAMEGQQRESAMELGREKESKIKLERQLAAAERLHRDGAAMIEATQSAMRREFEVLNRKRELEMGRAMKEASEQLAEAKGANAKLLLELEGMKGHGKEVLGVGGNETVDEWEGRALAQLNADIEGYRLRIRELLAERDLSEEPQFGDESGGDLAILQETITGLQKENAALKKEQEVAEKDREEMVSKILSSEGAWEKERSELVHQLEAMRQAHEAQVVVSGDLREAEAKREIEARMESEKAANLQGIEEKEFGDWRDERATIEEQLRVRSDEVVRLTEEMEGLKKAGQEDGEMERIRRDEVQTNLEARERRLEVERGELEQAIEEWKVVREQGAVGTEERRRWNEDMENLRRAVEAGVKELALNQEDADRKSEEWQKEREMLLGENRFMASELRRLKKVQGNQGNQGNQGEIDQGDFEMFMEGRGEVLTEIVVVRPRHDGDLFSEDRLAEDCGGAVFSAEGSDLQVMGNGEVVRGASADVHSLKMARIQPVAVRPPPLQSL